MHRSFETLLALLVHALPLVPAVAQEGSPPPAGRDLAARPSLQLGSICAPDWLPLFDGSAGVGPSGARVSTLAVFDGGTGPALYVGGNFNSAGGQPMNGIARWDGADWTEVGGGVDASVWDLAVFDDGSGPALYAAGNFTSAGGVAAPRVARWDGTSWSAVGGGLGWYVACLHVHDDGSGPQLYAGGVFTTPSTSIARWDGTSWSDVGGGISDSVFGDGGVYDLATYDDGTGPALYAGGSFDEAGGNAIDNIARWDGSTWSAVGSGTSGSVHALSVYDSGTGATLVAGGTFTMASGLAVGRVAGWDGTSWSALGAGVGDVTDAVTALAVHDDGLGSPPVLVVGGNFTTAGGLPVDHVASWNGSSWSALAGGGVLGGGSPIVDAIAGFDDGAGPGSALYVGGTFIDAGGESAHGVASWRGGTWSSLGGEEAFSSRVRCLAVHDDGSGPALYAGGFFSSVGGVEARRVARWDGEDWSALGTGFDIGSLVNAMASYDDGTGDGPALYVAGDFAEAGGVPASSIARWDGASWAPLGSGILGEVLALAVYDDGGEGGPELYAGGQFATAGGTSVTRIARWNGSAWRPVGGGVGVGTFPGVRAMAVHDDGSGAALYVGGSFQMAGGSPAMGIARWDGSTWSPLGSGMDQPVEALVSHDDGLGGGAALYAGGPFGVAGGVAASYVARWDGSAWSGLGSGANGFVYALASHDPGTGRALFAGGQFLAAGGVAAQRIARWDGAAWSSIGGELNDRVVALASKGEELFVGGQFTVSATGDRYLALYGGCAPDEPGTGYCFGDGSGSACPCDNTGASGEGCANSTGAGAVLSGSGSSSVAANDLVLGAQQLRPNQPALLFAGSSVVNMGDGAEFGDGLRCAGGSVRRFETRTAGAQGDASWGPGIGGGSIAPGQTWRFQVWYRDPGSSPCGSNFNLSNGYEIEFTP